GLNGQVHPYGFPTPEASITGDLYTPHAVSAIARPRATTIMPNMSNDMAVLQGSPTYKQRRRRTSISQHMSMVGNPQNAQFGHRPRAASVAENGLRNTLFNQGFQRHTTPLRDSPYQRTVTPIPNQIQPI